MPMYRILKPLSMGDRRIEQGGLLSLSMAQEKIDILEQRGAISRLYSPPIAEVPGWADRAARLPGNVHTVEDFLEAADDLIAKSLGVKVGEVPRLKAILQEVMFIPGEKPCGCI